MLFSGPVVGIWTWEKAGSRLFFSQLLHFFPAWGLGVMGGSTLSMAMAMGSEIAAKILLLEK